MLYLDEGTVPQDETEFGLATVKLCSGRFHHMRLGGATQDRHGLARASA